MSKPTRAGCASATRGPRLPATTASSRRFASPARTTCTCRRTATGCSTSPTSSPGGRCADHDETPHRCSLRSQRRGGPEMTFLSGGRLWLLVAPVLLLVAYLVAQRARQRAVVRFTDVDLLSSVAPTRTGWQRHIGAGLLLLTLVLLTVGFARPAATTRTPQKSA